MPVGVRRRARRPVTGCRSSVTARLDHPNRMTTCAGACCLLRRMEPVLRRFRFASVKDPSRCRLDPREGQDPVLALILERAGAGSRPGARSDPYSVRGSVSAGMCLMPETTDLVASFDRICGCSAGALTGSYLASGQASLAASTYTDAAKRRYSDRRRLMRGRPIVNLDLLFGELLAARRPHSRAGLVRGPDVRAVAVSPGRRPILANPPRRPHDPDRHPSDRPGRHSRPHRAPRRLGHRDAHGAGQPRPQRRQPDYEAGDALANEPARRPRSASGSMKAGGLS